MTEVWEALVQVTGNIFLSHLIHKVDNCLTHIQGPFQPSRSLCPKQSSRPGHHHWLLEFQIKHLTPREGGPMAGSGNRPHREGGEAHMDPGQAPRHHPLLGSQATEMGEVDKFNDNIKAKILNGRLFSPSLCCFPLPGKFSDCFKFQVSANCVHPDYVVRPVCMSALLFV